MHTPVTKPVKKDPGAAGLGWIPRLHFQQVPQGPHFEQPGWNGSARCSRIRHWGALGQRSRLGAHSSTTLRTNKQITPENPTCLPRAENPSSL